MPPGTTRARQVPVRQGAPTRSNKKKWLTAREFFKQVTETYTQSPYRPDAKLGIGDTYLGEGIDRSAGAGDQRVPASSSRSIRRIARADYAQYKLGLAHFRQMRAPQRDQTETRDAIQEFETFVVAVSEQQPDARGEGKLREARDRLSEADYRGRLSSTSGSAGIRARSIASGAAEDDPGFTGRDGVYFYLAESLIKVNRQAEALPYYEKLVDGVRAERVSATRREEADRRDRRTRRATPHAGRHRPTTPSPAPGDRRRALKPHVTRGVAAVRG